MSDMNLEQPVADSVEQHQDAIPGRADAADDAPPDAPLEADYADTAEQSRSVDPGEDDYR